MCNGERRNDAFAARGFHPRTVSGDAKEVPIQPKLMAGHGPGRRMRLRPRSTCSTATLIVTRLLRRSRLTSSGAVDLSLTTKTTSPSRCPLRAERRVVPARASAAPPRRDTVRRRAPGTARKPRALYRSSVLLRPRCARGERASSSNDTCVLPGCSVASSTPGDRCDSGGCLALPCRCWTTKTCAVTFN
jgi:hypothetical protein